MKTSEFGHDITIYVKFAKEEAETLFKAFDESSEYKHCIIPGPGAFMNANRGRFEFDNDSDLSFTDRQIDTCCKVLELASFGCSSFAPERKVYNELYNKMFNLHKQIVAEHKRITRTPDSIYKELRENEIISSLTEEDKEKFDKIINNG